MVGYDMSWASFHVLEVMSSPKYHQKRVGYLGAVQTFRPDTEVLMLATNLLKKVSDTCATCTDISHTLCKGPWNDYADCHLASDRYLAASNNTVSRPLDPSRSPAANEP